MHTEISPCEGQKKIKSLQRWSWRRIGFEGVVEKTNKVPIDLSSDVNQVGLAFERLMPKGWFNPSTNLEAKC